MASLFVPLPLTCSRILSLETQSLADQSPCSLSSTPSSGMEHLWSRAVATGGNRWQMERPRKWLRQANSVAVGCDRLPRERHGKEGVDGSSRQRASAKAPQSAAFCLARTCRSPACGGYGALYGALRFRTRAGSVEKSSHSPERLSDGAEPTWAERAHSAVSSLAIRQRRHACSIELVIEPLIERSGSRGLDGRAGTSRSRRSSVA
jgi:hypothetical protein